MARLPLAAFFLLLLPSASHAAYGCGKDLTAFSCVSYCRTHQEEAVCKRAAAKPADKEKPKEEWSGGMVGLGLQGLKKGCQGDSCPVESLGTDEEEELKKENPNPDELPEKLIKKTDGAQKQDLHGVTKGPPTPPGVRKDGSEPREATNQFVPGEDGNAAGGDGGGERNFQSDDGGNGGGGGAGGGSGPSESAETAAARKDGQAKAADTGRSSRSQAAMNRGAGQAAGLAGALKGNADALTAEANKAFGSNVGGGGGASARANAAFPPASSGGAAPAAQGDGGGALGAQAAQLSLAAGPYRRAFDRAGLKPGHDEQGRPAILRNDGTVASSQDVASLRSFMGQEPSALSRQPNYFNPAQGGISPTDFDELKADFKAVPALKEKDFKDIDLEDDKDFKRSRSCDKVSGDCNEHANDSYKKGDDVPADELAEIRDAIRGYIAEAEKEGLLAAAKSSKPRSELQDAPASASAAKGAPELALSEQDLAELRALRDEFAAQETEVQEASVVSFSAPGVKSAQASAPGSPSRRGAAPRRRSLAGAAFGAMAAAGLLLVAAAAWLFWPRRRSFVDRTPE